MKKKLLKIAAGLGAVVLLIAIALPTILHKAGLHPVYTGPTYSAKGKRALIITTSHSILSEPGQTEGPATGVFGSELTHPYYTFLDAGMEIDVASIKGGEIPIDPQSFSHPVITVEDKQFQKDTIFQAKVKNSLAIQDVNFEDYDLIFLSGGWGAAYDMAQSSVLATKITQAYYSEKKAVIGGVCHGVLGLVNAKDKDGNLLIAGRKMTGVTDKQLKELGIEVTPKHPETELRKAGALYEASTGFRDIFQTHVVIDAEKRFVTGQNQNSGLETSHKMLSLIADK
ncbi:type 1 glutamine amidotransferase domain-containing protein [Temperatibacter marinus]|uniref:Type 1 glutamine amidotransferase domain-containing protein n=1 Tax=Temperatibacter marinus TaxID=1456591 RepID=A0AA52EH15_9PROT|nr:type 1 glutamine amidotransferase domain-containing protein [Temperatibacter marinus]WND03003.1 type 1 glutamine amidotransferase domain-containing protein [Temperatibacter marinus]